MAFGPLRPLATRCAGAARAARAGVKAGHIVTAPPGSWSHSSERAPGAAALVALLGSASVWLGSCAARPAEAEAAADGAPALARASDVPPPKPSGPLPSGGTLPTFTREEVRAHASKSTGIWVTYGTAVYDVTKFVDNHPGGKRILLAAGKAIDPFWDMYRQHLTRPVRGVLEEYRIGDLDPKDVEAEAKRAEAGVADPDAPKDPYADEPDRFPGLLVRSARPMNAETPTELLPDALRTPSDAFFVRNHFPVPVLPSDEHAIVISGAGLLRPVRITVAELKRHFPKREIPAVMQCTGNRRVELNPVKPVKGLGWEGGAIGNAVWGGAALSDVLEAAGVALDREGDVVLSWTLGPEPTGRAETPAADGVASAGATSAAPVHLAATPMEGKGPGEETSEEAVAAIPLSDSSTSCSSSCSRFSYALTEPAAQDNPRSSPAAVRAEPGSLEATRAMPPPSLAKVLPAHVIFTGADGDGGEKYGASIPIHRALDPRADVLLAYEMNGEPLPRDHGAPLRVIVPGVTGCRSVKWLEKIELSPAEAQTFWQQRDYRSFSPSTDWDNVDWDTAHSVQATPVTSLICVPKQGDAVDLVEAWWDEQPQEGKENAKEDRTPATPTLYLETRGYAFSGNGQRIVRVDVSADGGKSWTTASLQQETAKPGRDWSWTLWSAPVPVPSESTEPGSTLNLIVKAVDESYNTQPERPDGIWNIRGILCNSWHRIQVVVADEEEDDDDEDDERGAEARG